MRYVRVCYMCPECNQMQFFNEADEFSTKCPECNVEMKFMTRRGTTTEAEASRERRRKYAPAAPIVYCPYCNSLNTQKISTSSKVVNTALFGVFGTKRHKEWHCNRCNSDF